MAELPEPAAFPAPRHLSDQAQARLNEGRRRAVYPPAQDLAAWARFVEDTNAAARPDFARITPDLATERKRVGLTDVYMTELLDRPDGPVNLTFHGGGLTMFGGVIVASFAAIEAERYGLSTWAVDYRMPPLDPYPAGVKDGVDAYRHLLARRPAGSIVVLGSSAGGNIATATLLKARDEGLPMPAGLVLFSPEVDLTESGDSFAVLADADTTLESLSIPNALYAGDRDLSDPLISPLFASFDGFPPTLIQSGTRDLFLSNAVRLHRRLRNAAVESELHVFEAMPHGLFGGAPEDDEVTVEATRFINRVLS